MNDGLNRKVWIELLPPLCGSTLLLGIWPCGPRRKEANQLHQHASIPKACDALRSRIESGHVRDSSFLEGDTGDLELRKISCA